MQDVEEGTWDRVLDGRPDLAPEWYRDQIANAGAAAKRKRIESPATAAMAYSF